MPDAELVARYRSMLSSGFANATADSEPISPELDEAAEVSLLKGADHLANQLEHSILDAPWLRGDVAKLVDEWMASDTPSLTDLRQTLDPLFGAARSLMIARTETAGAFNGGIAAGLRAHGWTSVVWIASSDACPECAELDGTVMTLAEYESNSVLHPNCACTCEPYDESSDDSGESDEDDSEDVHPSIARETEDDIHEDGYGNEIGVQS